jgi:hypothetical protein
MANVRSVPEPSLELRKKVDFLSGRHDWDGQVKCDSPGDPLS